jgi:GNAT superfamily N-acetyltransferase
MGDKRVVTRLCDVISGAERRVTNSAALWVRVRTDHETPFGKVAAVASIRASWRVSIGVNTAEIFEIRPGRVDDVRVILQLIRDLATYERAPDEVSATEEQLIEVLFGERPAAEVLLALEGETPVGFAVYFYNFSTWLGRAGLYLEDLFIRPEKRGRGYGRALLVELAKIARDRGCSRMEWAVLNWNERAIKFYQALGAKPMNEWTVFRLTRGEIAKLADAADTAATTEPNKE